MRAHFIRPVTDQTGSPVRQLQVLVTQSQSNATPIASTLYVNQDTSEALSNPFTVDNGVVEFFVDTAQTVDLILTTASSSYTVRDLDILPPSETIVTSPTGLTITNTPAEGQFLQAADGNHARWVYADEIATTQPTPLQTTAAFSSDSENTLLAITNIYGRKQGSTMVPVGTGQPNYPGQQAWTYAVSASGTDGLSFSTGPQNLPETGFAVWIYKVVSKTVSGAPSLSFTVDSDPREVDSPVHADYLNSWCFGYFGDIEPGTTVGRLEYRPGTDPTAYILIGALYLFSGDNIPAHSHSGTGPETTMLGPDAQAEFSGSTVVGASGKTLGERGTVVGSHALAATEGTAVGAYSYASRSSSSFGFYATTEQSSQSAVAIGYKAHVEKDSGVAVGARTTSSGVASVAIGAAALSEGTNSVSVGPNAKASANYSAALGSNAQVNKDHTNSVAFGPDSKTTAANQIVLGSKTAEVHAPGNVMVYGNAILGGKTSTLGFYGSSGTTKPVIYGDSQGNQVVKNLLISLELLGLVDDQTTDGSS